MPTSAILIIIVLSLGAIQGLIYGFKLFSSHRIANKILALILFLFSYRLIIQILRLFGIGYYDIWYYFMIDVSWSIGPLIYLYIKSQIEFDFSFRKSQLVHSIPVITQISFSEFVRLQNLFWDGTKESLSWLGYWGYVIWMNNSTIYIVASILIIIYSIKSLFLINKPMPHIEIDTKKVIWIKRIIYSFGYYFAIVLLILIIDLLVFNLTSETSYFYFNRFYYFPFFIGISILTYWIGLEGYHRKDEIMLVKKYIISKDELKYLSSLAEKIEYQVNINKAYKTQDLTLQSLANLVDEKPYQLSRCFKEVLDTKFTDYVNKFRIKEFKTLLNDPNNKHFTLLSLALDAGFNSKSSLNRAVKRLYNKSPKELKNIH